MPYRDWLLYSAGRAASARDRLLDDARRALSSDVRRLSVQLAREWHRDACRTLSMARDLPQ